MHQTRNKFFQENTKNHFRQKNYVLLGHRFCRIFSKENFYPKTNCTYRLLFAVRNFKARGIKIENNARSNRIWWPILIKKKTDENGNTILHFYQHKDLKSIRSPFEKIKNALKYSLEDFGREHKTA